MREQGSGVLVGEDAALAAGLVNETLSMIDLTTGDPSWTREISGSDRSGLVASVLSRVDDTVLAGAMGYVVAVDIATGEERWKAAFDGSLVPSRSGLLDASTAVVSLDRPMETDDAPPEVVAIDLETGISVWTTKLRGFGYPIDLQPMGLRVTEDTILVSVTSGVFGLDPETGGIQWVVESGRAERGDADGYVPEGVAERFHPSPLLVDNGTVYAGDPNGELVAIDARSGGMVFQRESPPGRVIPFGVVDGRLLVVDATGVSALDPADGSEVWHVTLDEVNAELFQDDTIYAAARGAVTAISPEGEILWEHETDDHPLYSLVVSESGIAVSGEKRIENLDANSGERLWVIPQGAYEPPEMVRDGLLVSHTTGTLALYDPPLKETVLRSPPTTSPTSSVAETASSTTMPAPPTTALAPMAIRSCDTLLYVEDHDWGTIMSADKIGPVAFLSLGSDPNRHRPAPHLLRPDNSIKYVVTVKGDYVGPIEVKVSPSDKIRLNYAPDFTYDPPAPFVTLPGTVRFETCDRLSQISTGSDGSEERTRIPVDTSYDGGIVAVEPGCYTFSATDLGSGESAEKTLPIGRDVEC